VGGLVEGGSASYVTYHTVQRGWIATRTLSALLVIWFSTANLGCGELLPLFQISYSISFRNVAQVSGQHRSPARRYQPDESAEGR